MTQPFRFVLCADVRLDAPFRCASDGVRAQLIEAGRTAFRRAVDACLEHEVAALVVTGSLFDEARLSVGTEDFLVEQVARLDEAGIDLVLTGARTNCAASMAWNHERVLFISPENGNEVLLRRDEEIVGRLVAAHEGSDESAPVRRAQGRQPAALLPPPCNPGPLVGRHFGEPGRRGALLVELPEHGEVSVRELPVAPVRWETVELTELEDVTDASTLAHLAAEEVRRRHGEPAEGGEQGFEAPRWMLRVRLHGATCTAERLSDDELLTAAGEELARTLDAFHVEFLDDGLVRPVDVDEHRGQPHVLGLSLDVAEELLIDDDLLDRVSPAELAGCTAGDLQAKRAYLRGLLGDVEASIAEALVKEGAR